MITNHGNLTSQWRNIAARNSRIISVMKKSPPVTKAPAIAGRTANANGILCHVGDSPSVGASTISAADPSACFASCSVNEFRRLFTASSEENVDERRRRRGVLGAWAPGESSGERGRLCLVVVLVSDIVGTSTVIGMWELNEGKEGKRSFQRSWTVISILPGFPCLLQRGVNVSEVWPSCPTSARWVWSIGTAHAWITCAYEYTLYAVE